MIADNLKRDIERRIRLVEERAGLLPDKDELKQAMLDVVARIKAEENIK